MIDEASRRKPGINWDECVPVAFGDGQDWLLPRPTVDVFALFEGGRARREVRSSFGAPFDELRAGVEAADGDGFFPAVATLAADLLRRNYELSDADLGDILRFRVGDDDSRGWMGGVLTVAAGGDAPKASAGGSD